MALSIVLGGTMFLDAQEAMYEVQVTYTYCSTIAPLQRRKCSQPSAVDPRHAQRGNDVLTGNCRRQARRFAPHLPCSNSLDTPKTGGRQESWIGQVESGCYLRRDTT